MGKAEDLTGKRFGRLVAIERDMEMQKITKKTCWKCQCDCGNIVSVRSADLKRGHTSSCGCLHKESCSEMGKKYGPGNAKVMGQKYGAINGHKNFKDISGQKFGRLTALERVGKEYPVKWKCKCDCGNEVIVDGSHLRSGHTQSCGCILQEYISTLNQIAIECNTTFLKTGEKYGKLTVIEYDNERSGKGNGSFHICSCDCGNIISVKTSSLINKRTMSCGCNNSKGEFLIANILKELNIPFVSQKTFPDLLGNNSALKFDFYLNNNNIAIEFQGKQHFEKIDFFGGEEQFQKQKEYDNKKRDYCQRKNIRLIEIPYWDLDKIDSDYILSLLKL